MSDFKFLIQHTSKKSRSRCGLIFTPNGVIETPCFVPVATHSALKAVPIELAPKIELMFCNTYHLLLHPGAELIKKSGGIHNFMNRKSPIITDSGGFQVFSLAYGGVREEIKSCGKKNLNNSVIKITEEGVTFRSYRDGTKILLTPENSILTQKSLGADIIIPLDELLPYHSDEKYLHYSLERTHRWEERSLKEHLKNPNNQGIYGVIHGGIDLKLRKKSCEFLANLDFDGFAIGGSVGKNKKELFEVSSFVANNLPYEKPIHLLGIGDIFSIVHLVSEGIDSFDSSYPTKAARHGCLFSSKGIIKIEQKKYSNDFSKPDPNCDCLLCKNHSLAYLHHLFKSKEINALIYSSVHNLHYMSVLMKELRRKIMSNEI